MKKIQIKGMFETIGQRYYDRMNQAVIAHDLRKEFKDDLVIVSDPEKEAKKKEREEIKEARLERRKAKAAERKEKLKKLTKKKEEKEEKVSENNKPEEITEKEIKNTVQRYKRGMSKEEIEKINQEVKTEMKKINDDIDAELQKRKEELSDDTSLDEVVDKLVDMAYGDGVIMDQSVNGDGIIVYDSWEDFAKVNNIDNNIDYSSWIDVNDPTYMDGFEKGKDAAMDLLSKMTDCEEGEGLGLA